MDYALENLEDQMIATLQASSAMAGVNVRTHAGRVSIQMFERPEYYEGLITLLPFAFVRYNGRTAKMESSIAKVWKHELEFVLYIGAKSLRATRESQLSCYAILRAVFDALHGAWPNAQGQSLFAGATLLGGTQIAIPNFRALTPLMEAGGRDEQLVVELPTIAVYQTHYTLAVQTS